MKKLLTLAAVVIVALAASAQDKPPGVVGCDQDCACPNSNYNRIYVSYNPTDCAYNEDGHCFSYNLQGFSVGYLYGIKLNRTEPLYLELGGKVQYNSGESKDDVTTTLMSFTAPVNIAYSFSLGRGFSIVPYAGFNFKVNFLGKDKSNGVTTDHFNDCDANRVQLGFQMGCGVNWSHVYAALGCQCDITEYLKQTTTSGIVFTLGYNL